MFRARLARTAGVVSLTASILWAGHRDEKKIPKRADKPFVVWVLANPAADEDTATLEAARAELEKRLEKKSRWFRIADAHEDAEIVVELVAYSARPERRVLSTWGVVPPTESGQPDRTQYIEVLTHHTLRGQVSFFGAERTVTGSRTKRNKGRAEDAAKDFADRLENICKDEYWQLVESRERVQPLR